MKNIRSKYLFTIVEICELTALGRTSVYNAITAGTLTAKKFGSKTLITAEALENFINNLPPKEKTGGQSEQ